MPRLALAAVIPVVVTGLLVTDGCTSDPDRLFQDGRAAIALNCLACLGASPEALLEGIAKVESALDRGLSDPSAAQRTRADAFRVMALRFEPGAREAWLEKMRAAAGEAAGLAADDPAALLRYAESLDARESPAVLRHLLERHPGHVEGNWALGLALLEGDEVERALPFLMRTVERAEGAEARRLLPRVEAALREAGRVPLADRVAARLAALP